MLFRATLIIMILLILMASFISRVFGQVIEDRTPLFTLLCLINSTKPGDLAAATIWKEDLAKMGIDLRLEVLDPVAISSRMWGESWNKRWEEGGWDLTAPTMFTYIWDPTSLVWWESCWTAWGLLPHGWNNMGWTNARADMLVRDFFRTFNETKRRELMYEWQRIFVEDPPVILCFYPYFVVLHNPKITGFQAWRVCGSEGFDMYYDLNYEGKTEDDFIYIKWMTSVDTGLTRGWNPFFVDGHPAWASFHGLLSMVETEKGYKLAPLIAKSWEWSEDCMSMTFYLRDDVYWHDGVKLTAEDVVFSIEAALDPATGATISGDLIPVIDHAEALNETTVVIYLKEIYPDLPCLMSTYHFFVVPKHVLGNVPHSEWKTHETNTEGGKLPGCGPYKFKEWVKGQYWVLEAFDGYFGGRPFIDEIIFRVIPDVSTALMALEAGEIDVIPEYPAGELMAEYRRLKDEGKVAISPQRKPGLGFIYVNRNHPILANRHVVRALWYALNLPRIHEEVYFGYGQIANSPIHPMMPYYNPNNTVPTYDLNAARHELELAGYIWPRRITVPFEVYYVQVVGAAVGGAIVAAATTYAVTRKKSG